LQHSIRIPKEGKRAWVNPTVLVYTGLLL